MTENNEQITPRKKMLENPILGSLMVPVAIVLVGAFIIFGVTKMLSTEQSYKDLVREMQSKTFGNKWIAAFELSKIISSSQVPDEDVPWLIENLSEVYRGSVDPRTRDFVTVALGSLSSPLVFPFLEETLRDIDGNVKFHALVAIGNNKNVENFNWSAVYPFLTDSDFALRQAAVLALGSHPESRAKELIIKVLGDKEDSVRYSAATVLVQYKSLAAISTLKEILLMKTSTKFDPNQMMALKLNVLHALHKVHWGKMTAVIKDVAKHEKNIRVVTKAEEILNQLKN